MKGIFFSIFLISCGVEAKSFELESDTDTELELLESDTDTELELESDTDTGPESVCDESSCDCVLEVFWVCPLRPDPVVISSATYPDQWRICHQNGDDWVCPVDGYHRDCARAGGIGLTCR
jgi:hypothetical protein